MAGRSKYLSLTSMTDIYWYDFKRYKMSVPISNKLYTDEKDVDKMSPTLIYQLVIIIDTNYHKTVYCITHHIHHSLLSHKHFTSHFTFFKQICPNFTHLLHFIYILLLIIHLPLEVGYSKGITRPRSSGFEPDHLTYTSSYLHIILLTHTHTLHILQHITHNLTYPHTHTLHIL